MNIMIDETYGISSDTHNYILFSRSIAKSGKRQGENVDKAIAYCSTPASALKKYCDLKLRESDCSSFKEVIEEIKKLNAHIDKILEEVA